MHGASEKPTPFAVVCIENVLGESGCGKVYLTTEEYNRQMFLGHKRWTCPCGGIAVWDDENYETFERR